MGVTSLIYIPPRHLARWLLLLLALGEPRPITAWTNLRTRPPRPIRAASWPWDRCRTPPHPHHRPRLLQQVPALFPILTRLMFSQKSHEGGPVKMDHARNIRIVTTTSSTRRRPKVMMMKEKGWMEEEEESPSPSSFLPQSAPRGRDPVFPHPALTRRDVLGTWMTTATWAGAFMASPRSTRAAVLPQFPDDSDPLWSSSPSWTGTSLPLLSLHQAVRLASEERPTTSSFLLPRYVWPMARWPDPVLRQVAPPVTPEYWGTPVLQQAVQCLEATARYHGAVGLAAQQCGVAARIVTLQLPISRSMVTLINPRIVARSPERKMRVWQEHCLVLPPTFTATVVRDAWIDLMHQDMQDGSWQGPWRVRGELARAAQHELDHDRGILLTDHVALDDAEAWRQHEWMRVKEAPGHAERQARAFTRYLA